MNALNPYKNWAWCVHIYNPSILVRGWKRAEAPEAYQPDRVVEDIEKLPRDPVPDKVEGKD